MEQEPVNDKNTWLVCQIGAREHYGINRALRVADKPQLLLTDLFWPVRLGGLSKYAPSWASGLLGRTHDGLQPSQVKAFGVDLLRFELFHLKKDPWERIRCRNHWFQRKAVSWLDKHGAKLEKKRSIPLVFAYSYAARRILEWGRKRGWRTILGQIDPGPEETRLVHGLIEKNPEWGGLELGSPTDEYWDSWRQECLLADRIVVNSSWSTKLLMKEGVEHSKCRVLPLAFDGPPESCPSCIPSKFDTLNPLIVLFLGQVIARKGIHDLVLAAKSLETSPVQLDVVGPFNKCPSNLPANLKLHGSCPRSRVDEWYGQSHVFILPTHSDGFAITQLEAMAHGLPVIATPNCGEVVTNGLDGWIVPAGDPEGLAGAIRKYVGDPGLLRAHSIQAREKSRRFGLGRLAGDLLKIEKELAGEKPF